MVTSYLAGNCLILVAITMSGMGALYLGPDSSFAHICCQMTSRTRARLVLRAKLILLVCAPLVSHLCTTVNAWLLTSSNVQVF